MTSYGFLRIQSEKILFSPVTNRAEQVGLTTAKAENKAAEIVINSSAQTLSWQVSSAMGTASNSAPQSQNTLMPTDAISVKTQAH